MESGGEEEDAGGDGIMTTMPAEADDTIVCELGLDDEDDASPASIESSA